MTVGAQTSDVVKLGWLQGWQGWYRRALEVADSGHRKRDLRPGASRKGELPLRSATFVDEEGRALGPSTRWTRRWPWYGDYAPPIVYVDDVTLARAVDVRELRRGDQVILPFIQMRGVVPVLDFVVSYLFCLEVCTICHHTIIIDDVAYVDEKGIPRKTDGQPVMIFDVSNSVLDILKELSPVGLWPTTLAIFMQNLGYAMFVPLAEYGDSPILMRLDHGHFTEKERDAIVERCDDVYSTFDDKKFNLFTNNCEHTSNSIVMQENQSPEVPYVLWTGISLIVRSLPLLLSGPSTCVNNGSVYMRMVIITVTFALMIDQGVVFMRRMLIGRPQWQQSLDLHDYRHLLAKETARSVLYIGAHVALLGAFERGLVTMCLCCSLLLLLPPMKVLVVNVLGHLVMFLLFIASDSVWLFPTRGARAASENHEACWKPVGFMAGKSKAS